MNPALNIMPLSLAEAIAELIKYKYLILFPVVVVEGPIITVIAGFLASLGYLNLFIAYGVVVFSDIFGDCLYYALGYWGREKFLDKWGRYIGANTERLRRIEKHFEQNGGRTLLLGKISHGIGGVFLVAAGLAKMPFRQFVWFNFIATLMKSLALLLIGFYFGEAVTKINSFLESVSAISVSIGFAIILVYFYKYNKSQENHG